MPVDLLDPLGLDIWDYFNYAGAVAGGALQGAGQGVLNALNGLQNIGVGVVNLTGGVTYNGTSWVMNQFGANNPYYWIPSPDWSQGLLVEEYNGGWWTDTHGWSMWAGGNALAIGGASIFAKPMTISVGPGTATAQSSWQTPLPAVPLP